MDRELGALVGERFCFERRGDRFAQRFKARVDAHWVTILESVEPAAHENQNDEWPASPALQDWHVEKRDGALVYMAVGRAGKTHWSLAVEVTPLGVIRCDVAARVYTQPGFLGSTFRCPAASRQVSATEIELSPGVLLQCDAELSRLHLDAASSAAEQSALVIEPRPLAAAKWPQTVRWRFEIC